MQRADLQRDGAPRLAAGVALLVAVVTAALVLPGLTGRPTAGRPDRVPLPPVPAVGACLSALADPAEASVEMVPTVTRCAGEILGEVVSIQSTPTQPEQVSTSDQCWAAVLAYAGVAVDVSTRRADSEAAPFVPALQFRPVPLGPSAADRDAGARWTGCAVVPLTDITYRGTLRNGSAGGAVPIPFTSCRSDRRGSRAVVPCTAPHTIEVLGYATMRNSFGATLSGVPVPDEFGAGCDAFASVLMHRADPTADGTLAVSLSTDPTSPTFGACEIAVMPGAPVARASLSGTLLGVGDGPLPWT